MMGDVKILHIGIAPREQIKRRMIAISKGEMQLTGDEPKIWISSLESLAKVLSSKNMLLLEMIRNTQPGSITELAKLSRRKKSNLSRTLHSMEHLGIVELSKTSQGRIVPKVSYDQVKCDFVIGTTAA